MKQDVGRGARSFLQYCILEIGRGMMQQHIMMQGVHKI